MKNYLVLLLLLSIATLLQAEVTFEEAAPPDRPKALFWLEANEADSTIKPRPDESTYGHSILYLATETPPDNDGYHATFSFTTTKGGEYTIWIACGKIGAMSISPMHFYLDNEELEVKQPLVGGTKTWAIAHIVRWNRLGEFSLKAGKHALKIVVTEPRKADAQYVFILDSVAVVEGGGR